MSLSPPTRRERPSPWVRDPIAEGFAKPGGSSTSVIEQILAQAQDLKYLIAPRFMVFENRWMNLIPLWVVRLHDEMVAAYPPPMVIRDPDLNNYSDLNNYYRERDALFLDAVRSTLEIKK